MAVAKPATANHPMKTLLHSARSLLWKLLYGLVIPAVGCAADNYQNFAVAIYIPVGAVQRFENPETLRSEWETISR